MTGCAVGYHRVVYASLGQLPCGEIDALVARPRFTDPDVDRHALLMGEINRREGRAPFQGGEPTRIAVRHQLQGFRRFIPAQVLQQRQRVFTDGPAICDIFFCNRRRLTPGNCTALRTRYIL